MKIAITGGTGLVGSHLAERLLKNGHDPVLIARRQRTELPAQGASAACQYETTVSDPEALARAFDGCDAVAHCAGINRELGNQTYERVHIEGTRNVVEAARIAEKLMVVPLTSVAQVRILSEGIVEPLPAAGELPVALRPKIPFHPDMIRAALPEPKRFGKRDLLVFSNRMRK